MEAMACGCKVVCSDIPDVKEWLSENVRREQAAFVKLPSMKNTDEPNREELPYFERRLADSIYEKLEQREEENPDLSKVSWNGVSLRILELLKK